MIVKKAPEPGHDGESVETLIRRIMARAEKEQIERDRKAAEENARRMQAKMEAIGVQVIGAPKVEAYSLDLEMRERPWNSRSHADRTDLLYESLYRPFTKNV